MVDDLQQQKMGALRETLQKRTCPTCGQVIGGSSGQILPEELISNQYATNEEYNAYQQVFNQALRDAGHAEVDSSGPEGQKRWAEQNQWISDYLAKNPRPQLPPQRATDDWGFRPQPRPGFPGQPSPGGPAPRPPRPPHKPWPKPPERGPRPPRPPYQPWPKPPGEQPRPKPSYQPWPKPPGGGRPYPYPLPHPPGEQPRPWPKPPGGGRPWPRPPERKWPGRDDFLRKM